MVVVGCRGIEIKGKVQVKGDAVIDSIGGVQDVVYKVKEGDCYWSIARDKFGTGFKWAIIWWENVQRGVEGVGVDADVVEVGAELVIPYTRLMDSELVDRAIKFARQYGEE